MPALPPGFPIVVIGSSCCFALSKGGREERIAAVAFGLACLAAPFITDHRWPATQWAMSAVDVGYFILLLTIALRTSRIWPLPATAFQLLAVLTDVASRFDRPLHSWVYSGAETERHVHAWAYITANVIWSYLGLTAIVVGTFNRWRERSAAA